MENIDNPTPTCTTDNIISVQQIIQQINEIMPIINKSKSFPIDKKYIEKIIVLHDKGISYNYINFIVHSSKHYTFDKTFFNKEHNENFIQILCFLIGRQYMLKARALCDSKIKNIDNYLLLKIYPRLISKLYYEQYFDLNALDVFIHFLSH